MQDTSERQQSTGYITIEKVGNIPNRLNEPQPHADQIIHRYCWHPSTEIAAELPPEFSLSFNCLVGNDKIRRFAPTHGPASLIVEASLSGSVLLNRYVKMSGEQRFSYHAMRLFYQLAPRFREYFSRAFKGEKDLYVPKVGRLDEAHILPDHLGLDCKGNGIAWTPTELMRRGREGACQAGLRRPDAATRIRYGLLEAARRNPFDLSQLSECPPSRNACRFSSLIG